MVQTKQTSSTNTHGRMEAPSVGKGITSFPSSEHAWWALALPYILDVHGLLLLVLSILFAVLLPSLVSWALTPGGPAWRGGRARLGRTPIPGPRGLPMLGSLLALSGPLPHRVLARTAGAIGGEQLMSFSIGQTPAVVTADPTVAEEILGHPSFADRPVKQSARELMFERAMGFAPAGQYWCLLRNVATMHLFAPRRIAAHEAGRRADCSALVHGIAEEQARNGHVELRRHLRHAALNSIMGTIFGKRYDVSGEEGKEVKELREMVREGFELLGAFNWCDHLPWLASFYDPDRVAQRCATLVPRVCKFVKNIIDEHRARPMSDSCRKEGDFVDVLLSLELECKLEEDDMIAVLWEMIFRSADNTALLTEWIMAELVLNPQVQAKLATELDQMDGPMTDAAVARLPYLQAIVKETLRLHPPGPLLSWARLSITDVQLKNGMAVPANTTAMVNMWAITHDPAIWPLPDKFNPERFTTANVDVRGGDLRLAPFGAGRRGCPGKNLALVSVAMWVARMVAGFEFLEVESSPVDLSEVLKLSCEMKNPLTVMAVPRSNGLAF